MHPLQAIPGVLESELTDAAAARLPTGSPAAPWTATLDAVCWLHPATRAAREHVPEALRGRRVLPVTLGALVRYRDGPVGPYSEVLASPVLLAEAPLPAATIPFIAVDSAASVHGGRSNWALPKVFAHAAWAADGHAVHVEGDGAAADWSLDAVVRPRRRELPFSLPLRARQPPPGGLVAIALAGRLRVATVDVDTHGPTLPSWLVAGRHPAVMLRGAQASFSPAAR